MAGPIRRAKTPARKKTSAKKRRTGWRVRAAIAAAALTALLMCAGAVARHLAPAGNTSLDRFDTLIVLGSPTDGDGNPSPTELARTTEAVHEYERGVAPHIILTGGAAHNRFVEAQAMARTAEAQGVPASAISIEPQALDTIENACYSVRIMKEHGWKSAEVISSPSHLPRAGLIFSRLPIAWHVHPAPFLGPRAAVYGAAATAVELVKTARYLVWARWVERCQP